MCVLVHMNVSALGCQVLDPPELGLLQVVWALNSDPKEKEEMILNAESYISKDALRNNLLIRA